MATLPSFPRPRVADIVAGASVALVLIPQSVAYADLAGMPAHIGLFASAFPLLVFSLFASSPYLQSGPTAVTSLLTFSALAATGYAETTEDYVRAGALLALFVGVTRLVLGLLRLGKLAFVVAEPVMVGFTSGAAIVIFSTQLSKVLGVAPPADVTQPLSKAIWSLSHVGQWQPLAIVIAIVTLALMLGGKKLHPLFPGVLVAVIIGVIFSRIIGLEDRFSRAVAGDPNSIPGSFPSLQLDLPWGDLGTIAIGGFIIALVGFAEPSAIARTYANEEQQQWNASQELVASGLANLTSSFSGTYPVGGSFSRSSLNKLAGAQTRMSGGVTGLLVLAALPLAPQLDKLPSAVLGAIVIGAVINLLKPKRLWNMWSRSKSLALVSYATVACTVLFAPDVYWAIAVGFVLAVLHTVLRPVRVHIGEVAETSASSLTLRPEGLVWLPTNKRFDEQLATALAEHPEATAVTLDLSRMTSVDADMASAIGAASHALTSQGRRLDVVDSPDGADRLIETALAALN